MGTKVDLLNEIYNRLYTATQSGGTMTNVKRVRIGSIEEARKQNDLPIINIQLVSGSEIPDHPNRMFYDDMQFEISLIHPKLAESNNTLFKTADSTGALFMLEKMLNVLDKNTSGTVNNTFNSSAGWVREVSYEVDESQDVVEIAVTVRVKTKSVALGGR